MGKLSLLKKVCTVFLFCAATAIPSSAQTFTTLVSFTGTNGAHPGSESLVQGTDGDFYGTTTNGYQLSGFNDFGNVFKISAGGGLTTLYYFGSQSGFGLQPYDGLVQATDGNFYGTTSSGGANDYGTVFKITPGGAVTTLHSFDVTDGAYPDDGLVQASDGNFYGTTRSGGRASLTCTNNPSVAGCGTVFKITLGGTLTTLHNFPNYPTDGSGPSRLVQATDGNLYGTTNAGGASTNCGAGGCGTVFKITPGGTQTTLYSFCTQTNCPDGSDPSGELVQATDGNLYGTSGGTVFGITPGGTLTTLHTFVGSPTDGQFPRAGLIQATDGNLYGTTAYGGFFGGGSVFRMTPVGTLTILYNFCPQTNCTSGDAPHPGRLVQGTDGNLYGTTTYGGFNDLGTIFRLSVGLGPFVETIPTSGAVGTTVVVLGSNLTGATGVSFNGAAATFTVVSTSEIQATVPGGATTGIVQVTTPGGTLNSNVPFQVTKMKTRKRLVQVTSE